jgi:hypothetical protein
MRAYADTSCLIYDWVHSSFGILSQPSGEVYRCGHPAFNARKYVSFFHHHITAFRTVHFASSLESDTKTKTGWISPARNSLLISK